MKTAELEVSKKTTQSINLVDGQFTPSEASFIVQALLNEKINYHKLQRLSITEGNCNDKTQFDNSRIEELQNEQKIAQTFFSDIRQKGLKLNIEGTLKISVAELV